MPVAHTSALKPAGSLSLSSGSSLAGVAVSLPACGASFELAWSAVRPCCHAGAGAAGAAAAGAGAAAGAAGVGAVDWHAVMAIAVAAASISLVDIESPFRCHPRSDRLRVRGCDDRRYPGQATLLK